MQPWKTVRIFVSSTFRDMHAERDHLVRVVFPELRERCAGRNLHLVDVDLRWGVTEEEAESGQVLDICLDEIERCRPFFVGILGERYGSAAALDKLPDEPRYEWLRQFAPGHSITALEIYHGVVRNLQMKGHAFFYFRDPAFIRDIPEPQRGDFLEEGGPEEQGRSGEESKAEKERRLRQIKAVVRQYWPVFDGYPCRYDGSDEDGKVRLAGLEAFGQRVLEDLWAAIVAEHPESEAPPDELAIERSYHEAFVAGRSRGFIGRVDLLAGLAAFVDGEDSLVVTGRPGSGKSALLARFTRDYALDRPKTFVLAHFIGAAPGSADIRKTLLRLCRELGRHFALAEEIPEEYEALRRTFPGLLERAAKRGRFVLVLDALDQLSAAHRAPSLNWLPQRLPAGARLVVSTLEGEILDRLRARKPPLPELEVAPLGRAGCREIVRRTLWEYRKRLAERPDEPDQDQLGLLLAKPDAGNPLYLAVACEELRVFGQFEQVTECVRTLAGDVRGLLEQVLARLEGEHGEAFVFSALSLLACSREGLLEGELLELLRPAGQERLAQAVWARFYRSLRPFLRPPGPAGEELLDFFHGQLEAAVRHRYLGSEGAAIGVHRRLAGLFRRHADPEGAGTWRGPPRALAELPYHLAAGQDGEGLEQTLCDLTYLEARCASGQTFELVRDYGLGSAIGAVAEFGRFVQARAHVLARHPEQVFSQASMEPVDSAPANASDASVGRDNRPWVRLISRPRTPSPCLMTLGGLAGHRGAVVACAFSPDGRRIVSASGGRMKLWDAVSGEDLLTRTGHRGAVVACAFSPDGTRIVSASEDKTLKVWDAASGAYLLTLAGHWGPVCACAFSPDGDRIASASDDKTLKLWDAASGEDLATLAGHRSLVRACAFGPDGRRIVSASADKTLKVWDAASGAEFTTLAGHSRWVRACAFSPDGTRIVSASADETLKVWDAATGEALRTFEGHEDRVNACAFSPDGTRIVSASDDKTLMLWDAATGEELATLAGHSESVNACAFSPDGTRIASASDDGTLQIWDAVSRACKRAPAGHSGGVLACAFSPDDRRIVSASHDKTLKVWDAATGEALQTLEGHEGWVRAAAFSPDGRRVVSASDDRTLKVWDAATGEALMTLEGHEEFNACAFSRPDGGRIVSASRFWGLELWDAASGKVLRTLGWCKGRLHACAFSPDGRRIVSASDDGTLQIWDTASGEALRTLAGHGKPVNACAFSPNGTRIVSASDDRTLKVWDAATGEALRTLAGHGKLVNACAFSPDGTRIASASDDGTLQIWDAVSAALLAECQIGGTAGAVAWSVVGRSVAVGTGDGRPLLFAPEGFPIGPPVITAWRWAALSPAVGCPLCQRWSEIPASTLGTEHSCPSCGERLAINPFPATGNWRPVAAAWAAAAGMAGAEDVITRAAADAAARVMTDASLGEELATLAGHSEAVNACAFSPDGRRIVSASSDGTLKLWDADSGAELMTLARPEAWVSACAFSPDGTLIVSASLDGTLILWDAESGEELVPLASCEGPLHACAFSPDGRRIVSASADETLKVWDAATGEALRTLEGHEGWVNACAFSPDGTRIVSGSRDRTLKVWDAATGEALRTLEGHEGWVNACAFSPDGTRIVSASDDKTLMLWDAESGEELAFAEHGNEVPACAFSPDGRRIVSASIDGTLKLWDVDSGDLVAGVRVAAELCCVSWSPDGRLLAAGDYAGKLRIWALKGLHPAPPPSPRGAATCWHPP